MILFPESVSKILRCRVCHIDCNEQSDWRYIRGPANTIWICSDQCFRLLELNPLAYENQEDQRN
jgi:hypothetical protein